VVLFIDKIVWHVACSYQGNAVCVTPGQHSERKRSRKAERQDKKEKSMAKVTVILCDVKPCTSQAEREFEMNGQTLYVCGEQCFARFWSREFNNWKESPYRMQVTCHHLSPMPEYTTREVSVKNNSIEIFKSELHIVKPQQG
jgi:hypothetical protein